MGRALWISAVLLFAAITVDAQQAAPPIPQVSVTAGRSTIVATTFDVTRIAITNPAIADAVGGQGLARYWSMASPPAPSR
jgi:Flp pilus assembly secretin CpaC